MATENIVSKVYRVLTDVSSRVWDKISFWCLAKDVELANGKNLETTCGSITGITSSLTSTSTTMAASASAIKQLNDKIADLNSNLGANEVCVPMTITGTNVNWKLSTSIKLDDKIYKANQVKCTSANYIVVNGTQVNQGNTLDVSSATDIYATSTSATKIATMEIVYVKQ